MEQIYLMIFWTELEINKSKLTDEIEWMKKFIYFMWYGQWIFIENTWIPWYLVILTAPHDH